MKTLKSPADCLKQVILTSKADRLPEVRNCVAALKRRLRQLRVGKKAAHRLLLDFNVAIFREGRRLDAAEKRAETLAAAAHARSQARVSVSSVPAGERGAQGEDGAEEKGAQEERAQEERKLYPLRCIKVRIPD